MTDPLELLLKRTEGWEPPPPNVTAVKGRGKTLKLRRAVLSSSLAVILVASMGISTMLAADAWRDDARPMILPPADDISPEIRAKVARFAFHALVETGSYAVDYKGVEEVEGGWTATFVSGPTLAELEENLRVQKRAQEDYRAEVQQLQAEISQAKANGDQRSLRDAKKRLRIALDVIIPDTAKDIEALMAAIQNTREVGGPHVTEISVQQRNSTFRVSGLRGPYEGERREAIESFAEKVPERPIGYEFFDVDIIGNKRDLSWMGRAFYIGEVPSPEVTRCGVRLFNRKGTLVARTPEDRYIETDAAANEDARDGISLGLPIETVTRELPPPHELTVANDCHLVEGGWVPTGRSRIEPVEPGDRQSHSSYPLDPERHVFVETFIRYQGEVTRQEHICIASVFDADGDLIDSHGLTLYPSEEDTSGRRMPISIAVDVGDPSLAHTASLRCQPVVPGVPLGPDQEDGPN